jgi:hypothetical protein
MYDLTIITPTDVNTTAHNDFPDAHQALMSHVIAQDLYLHAKWPAPRDSPSFKLLCLDEGAHEPRVVAIATIAPAPAKPVIGPYYSAHDALRWTADHTATWRHGCDTDPGVRYPLAVLTAARAEARRSFVTAGMIFSEVAALSDAGTADVTRPSQHTFERLRDSAIAAGRNATITNAAELAAAVQAHLTPEITPVQTAALIWYYALILWGVTAP